MKRYLINIYKKLFVKKRFYSFHSQLLKISLWGLGALNSENDNWSGEEYFIRYLTNYGYTHEFVVFDVGANVGHYSNQIKSCHPNAKIYAFEPSSRTFKVLQAQASQFGYQAFNLGLSDTSEIATLYDHSTGSDSQHASLYREAIEEIHHDKVGGETITLTTIDEFIHQHQIKRQIFLKIDTEGNEFKVLKGATQAIQNRQIPLIQFEFNEMNVMSKVFLRDFNLLLPQFDFYRMLPDGLVPLTTQSTFLREIFAFQNIVAIFRK